MYKLPLSFDAEVFTGRVVNQVFFTVNTVSVSFEGDLGITLMSSFGYDAPGGALVKESPPVRHSDVMSLAGQTVTACEAFPDGTLALTFGNGWHLWCYDDSTAYESYSIVIGPTEIFV